MGFLNPWLLLGTLGIAVPIIIHLLNRFRHRRVQWGAMELLRRAIVLRSRQIQIEDLLLLAMRCLAVLLVALAMARPTLTSTGKLFFSEPQVGAVIALDASYSMTHRPGAASRFDRAIESLREIKKTLQPGSPVSLVLMGDSPRIILRNTAYDDDKFEKAIKELAPLPERLNLEVCLEQVAALVAETTAPSRECYLVSDAQGVSWENLSDVSRRALQSIESKARVLYLPTTTEGSENLAITHFALKSGSLRKGNTARYVAEVTNCGKRPQDSITVSLLLDGSAVDQQTIDRLEPGQTRPVALMARFERQGNVRITARIKPDAVELDNERAAVGYVRDQIRVLIVDGEPSAGPGAVGASYYVQKALAPRSVGKSRFAVELDVASWIELGGRTLANYDVVILANVQGVRQEKMAELDAFVRRGGGLMVFLGDKTSPKLFTTSMIHNQTLLLPGEIVEPLTAPADKLEGWNVRSAVDHPLASIWGMLPAALQDEARVARLFKVELDKDAVPILAVTATDAEGKSLDAPLLAEKIVGQGKVLLVATSPDRRFFVPDRRWSNLPIHAVFAMLMQESLTHLTRREHERPVLMDEPLVCRLPQGSTAGVVSMRGPDGRQRLFQVTERDGARFADCGKPAAPGFYEANIDDKTPLLLAVNVNPAESRVATLDAEALARAFTGLKVDMPPAGDLAQYIKQSRIGFELWKHALALALVVLLVEMLLAWKFARRMSTAASVSVSGQQAVEAAA